jgi:hypothetical protein
VYAAMKSKARGKFNRLSVFDSKVPANKKMAAELAQECWIDVTKENILDAWDLEGAVGDWIGGTEFADDEGAEDDVAFDIEFGCDDVDMRDISLVDERDVPVHNNNEWED